jgi:hypothetical protein
MVKALEWQVTGVELDWPTADLRILFDGGSRLKFSKGHLAMKIGILAFRLAERSLPSCARRRQIDYALTFAFHRFLALAAAWQLPTIADVSGPGQSELVTPHETGEQNRVEGIGCAWTVLGVNGVLMGLLAASSVQGPYSSSEQELWYRYGSLGFFFAGAALPAIALFAARRSRWIVIASTVWMLMLLLAFAWFAMMSGGGL